MTKKSEKVTIVSSCSALFLLVTILLTLFYFLPEARQSKIRKYIDNANYESATALIEKNHNYGQSEKLAIMCKAGKAFEKKDFEKGIDYIYKVGGKVNVSYDPNGGTTSIESETIKKSRDIKNVASKDGYTFFGWNQSDYALHSKDFSCDLDLIASYKPTTYTITYNLDGGTNSADNPSTYNIESDTIVLLPATRTGYTFAGWEYEGTTITEIAKGSYGDKILTAKWSAISYSITYNLDGGTNNPNNPTSYTISDCKTLFDATKDGYTFDGWYIGDTKYVIIPQGTYGDLTFTAHWTYNFYNLIITNNDASKGNVTGSGSYERNSSVTILATPATNYAFFGWFSDSELTKLVSRNPSFTFTMPSNDVHFYAKFWTKTEDDQFNISHGITSSLNTDENCITYGMYPQTNINDPDLIAELNKLSNCNEYGYYFYNNDYYYHYDATPFECGYTFENGQEIITNSTYWFKVEPIKWVILDNEDGTYLLTTKFLLVNHAYSVVYSGVQSRTDYQGNTDVVYANNYKYSNERSWLNTDFYNQAFCFDNDNIKVSEVDNSVSTTKYETNPYVCENTFDKLFLLSDKDLSTYKYGFCPTTWQNDTKRECKVTDYAKAHGASFSFESGYYNNGTYHTRSPYCCDSTQICGVGVKGSIYDYGGTLDSLSYSVRPALRLTLD